MEAHLNDWFPSTLPPNLLLDISSVIFLDVNDW